MLFFEKAVPPGVTKLVRAAFGSNNSMTERYLPLSLKTIDYTAFMGCANIDRIILPDGLTEIGESAFAWDDEKRTSLEKQIIYVPQSVVTFGKYAIFGGGIEIYGFADSEAQKYAEKNNIPFTVVTESMYSVEEYNKALSGQIETVPEIPVQTIQPKAQTGILNVFISNNVVSVTVNGDPVSFDDAKPFIDGNGRTQIPIRAVAETLGCTVDWNGQTRTATLTKGNTVVVITIGEANMQVGTETVTMDTTAQIVNDRTYIPVRFVGEALGMEVNWIE